MSRYIKSVPETTRLADGLKDLSEELKSYKMSVEKNGRELTKINERAEEQKVLEIKKLQEKIKKLETQTQWAKSSEPALKTDSDYLMKKLDIL